MNTALVLALAVLFTVLIGGTLVAGRGSLRRGMGHVAEGLKKALSELLLYAALFGAALLVAVLADGDAWTFVAMAMAGACLLALVIILVVRHRRQN